MEEDKKEKFKFKFKVFLIYLFLEPWTERITLPNFSTIIWGMIIVSLIIRKEIFLWISVGIGIIFYTIKEWKSGKFIYWYHQRRYRKRNEALKKVREEKKNKFIETPEKKDEMSEVQQQENSQVQEQINLS